MVSNVNHLVKAKVTGYETLVGSKLFNWHFSLESSDSLLSFSSSSAQSPSPRHGSPQYPSFRSHWESAVFLPPLSQGRLGQWDRLRRPALPSSCLCSRGPHSCSRASPLLGRLLIRVFLTDYLGLPQAPESRLLEDTSVWARRQCAWLQRL